MTLLEADGHTYHEDRPLWHDGTGQPKRKDPPRQTPDLGGVSKIPLDL